MRIIYHSPLAVVALLGMLATPEANRGQPPPVMVNNPTPKPPKPPPDEFRALVKEVEEAYKAPFEVDEDIRDELRKQYRNPTPEREGKILREARRLYQMTPEQEQNVIRELRRAYEKPSPEQEEMVFRELRRGGRLPEGTVPISVQEEQVSKLFRAFDRDADGRLKPDEMPDGLRGQVSRWDRNRDGAIDLGEYAAYYQTNLRSVSARVVSGDIAISLPKGPALPGRVAPVAELSLKLSKADQLQPPPLQGPVGSTQPTPRDPPVNPEAVAIRFGKLPPSLPNWFTMLDTDRDGQVGLYEWRAGDRPLAEFSAMDLDGDGLLPPDEYLRHTKKVEAESRAAKQPSEMPTEQRAGGKNEQK